MRFPLLLAASLALVACVPTATASSPNCNNEFIGKLCDATRDVFLVVCAVDPAGPTVDPMEIVPPPGPTACYYLGEACDGLHCVALDCILYGTDPTPLECYAYCVTTNPAYVIGNTEEWIQGCLVVNPDRVEQAAWDLVEFVESRLP